MPTYAYACPSCGHQFERFQKMTVKARPKCPKCGTRAERVITGGAGLLFKGSGFYITDYKKGGAPDKPGKSPDAKPETKADPASGATGKPDAGASTKKGSGD